MINNKQNKKNIIIFNPSIEDGGVEKNLYLITNFLAKNDKKVYLITCDLNRQNKFSKKINFLYSKYYLNSGSGRYAKYLSCLITLINTIYNDKNYLVLSFQANIYCIIICWLLNVKIIARLNTAPQGWDHNFFKNKIYNYFIKKANAVLVNSKFFKKEVDKRYNLKSILIYNPFDFKKIKKLSNYKIKNLYKKETINLINVGRLTDQKDQITIIKSLITIVKTKKIKLIIVGKGKKEFELKQFAKKNNLENYVNFIGYKNNPYPYIKKADIFILSSKYEGSPNVLIEAQFLNKYIISTDCPTGPREILENYKNSKLIKVGDFVALANIIKNFKKIKLKKNLYFFQGLYKYQLYLNCNKYLQIINHVQKI